MTFVLKATEAMTAPVDSRVLPDTTSGLAFVFDADELTGLSASDAVSSWPSSGGSVSGLALTAGASAPTYVPDGINGHAAVAFAYVTRDTMLTPTGSVNIPVPATYAFVLRPDDHTAQPQMRVLSGAAGAYHTMRIDTSTGSTPGMVRAGANADYNKNFTAITLGDWQVIVVRIAPVAAAVLNDEVVPGHDTVSFSGTATRVRLSGRTDGADQNFNGQVAYVAGWARGLTDEDMQAVARELAARYGLAS